MKRDIEFALAERYPFFVPEDLHDFVSGDMVNGGCAHEDGWRDVLEKLFRRLTERGVPSTFKLVQVKEKYGVLRVHDNGMYDYGREGWAINALYAQAAAESAVTCEVCGQPGYTHYDTRVRTLCDACYAQ